MTHNLLIEAFDILVAGLLVVFLFLILLTVLTYGLVFLFPEHTTPSESTSEKNKGRLSEQQQPASLTPRQQAAIAAAVHRYRQQHTP